MSPYLGCPFQNKLDLKNCPYVDLCYDRECDLEVLEDAVSTLPVLETDLVYFMEEG